MNFPGTRVAIGTAAADTDTFYAHVIVAADAAADLSEWAGVGDQIPGTGC